MFVSILTPNPLVSFACRPHTGRKSLLTQTPRRPFLPGRAQAPPPTDLLSLFIRLEQEMFSQSETPSHTLNKPLIHGHRLYGTL